MSSPADAEKRAAAEAALEYTRGAPVVGVGTGSTTAFFIDLLSQERERPEAVVASSERTAALLRDRGLRVVGLEEAAAVEGGGQSSRAPGPAGSHAGTLPIYVDGADEVDPSLRLIKGRGGAHAREKVLAAAARLFVCIVDESKLVKRLGTAPVPVEVLPMAETVAAVQLAALGGQPRRRPDFITDNGNLILDVTGLDLTQPERLEVALETIPGVVACGLFALRRADVCLVGTGRGVEVLSAS